MQGLTHGVWKGHYQLAGEAIHTLVDSNTATFELLPLKHVQFKMTGHLVRLTMVGHCFPCTGSSCAPHARPTCVGYEKHRSGEMGRDMKPSRCEENGIKKTSMCAR